MEIWTPGIQAQQHSGISSELQDKLQNGVKEIGWAGDPSLFLMPASTGVEVVQVRPNEAPTVVIKWSGPLDHNFFLHLALCAPKKDPKIANEVVKRIYDDTTAQKRDADEKAKEELKEGAARVAYIARKIF